MEAARLDRTGRALAVGLSLPFALSSCVLPWGRDQGIYGQAGLRVLQGRALYAETFAFKPPLTAWVHALAMALFGRDMTAIRALAVLAPQVPDALLARVDRLGRPLGSVAAWAVAIGLVACVAFNPFAARFAQIARVVAGRSTLAAEWRVHGRYNLAGMSLADDLAVADWLDAHTPPDRPVFLWTYDPLIYVLARRDMASRFPYTYPFVIQWAPAGYPAELLGDLERGAPSAVVVGRSDATPIVTGNADDSFAALQRFLALRDWLARDYADAGSVGHFSVYLRRDASR